MKFREEAVRKLESPEQLDEMARLASIPSWLTTVALSVVVLAAGIWSVFATVTRTVSVPGVLTVTAGTTTLDAARRGRVDTVLITPRQRVRKGEPLYTLSSPSGSIVTVTAPWTTRVVSVLISEGQSLGPNSKVAVLERSVTTGGPSQATVRVAAHSVSALRTGMSVHLSTTEAGGRGSQSGVVTAIDSVSEQDDPLGTSLGPDLPVRRYPAAGPVARVAVRLATGPLSATDSPQAVSVVFTVAREHPIDWLVKR
ncbi:HlyD family efflux transporter periplasmic adaptor subunit [Streptomyces avermitilis]